MGWGAVLTQIPHDDLEVPVAEQRHEPLAFLSGVFRGASKNWAVPDQEAFPIREACVRLDYFLYRPLGFHIYTDHRNLKYVFEPSARKPKSNKPTARRLERWALELRSFDYVIEHIPGEDNVWADMMSRWGGPVPVPTVARVSGELRVCVVNLVEIVPDMVDAVGYRCLALVCHHSRSATHAPKRCA